MRKSSITIDFELFDNMEQLNAADRELVSAARKACKKSYSPFSHFSVGAAVRLDDGKIITGANQENAAFPSGLCAERVALFACGMEEANAEQMAVVARDKDGRWVEAFPCGACRQVMLQTESRACKKLCFIISIGEDKFMKITGADSLLPFAFSKF